MAVKDLKVRAFFPPTLQSSRLKHNKIKIKTLLLQGKMVGVWSFLIILRVVEAVAVVAAVAVDVGVVEVRT